MKRTVILCIVRAIVDEDDMHLGNLQALTECTSGAKHIQTALRKEMESHRVARNYESSLTWQVRSGLDNDDPLADMMIPATKALGIQLTET